ncbi:MAG: HEAT repeat domain-containing protein [Planctomycetia bacterium]|nr:HEAT repeat domain-containing protein [Planctomycetia bacterium]
MRGAWSFPVVVLTLAALGLPGCRAVGSSWAAPAAVRGAHDDAPGTPVAGGASGSASADPRIAALYARDFTVRARAGERLVAEGEAALDLLGRAADAERGTPGPSRVAPVLAAVLAEVPVERLQQTYLASREPAVRAATATELGRRDAWAAVPALIDRVEDPDGRVRASSVAALRRLTNRLYDVDLALGAATAAQVAARERTWWRLEGSARPARRASGG